MKILLVVPSFHTGGGEIFALRLANAFAKEHQVAIYSLSFKSGSAPLDIQSFGSPNLSFLEFNSQILKLLYKLINLDFLLLLLNGVANIFRRRKLLHLISDFKPDIVNTHLIAADFIMCDIKEKMACPWVITMHGSYEHDLTHRVGKKLRTLSSADGVVYIAQKNLSLLKANGVNNLRLQKIYNGFQKPQVTTEEIERFKKEYQLTDRSFAYVMVARADSRKGWEEAIKAFLLLSLPDCRLLLVGKGKYMEELERKFFEYKNISFVKNEVSVFPALANSHIGLLPTYYPTESLPNSISEYLTFGLPSIATDIGDIKAMLETNEGSAGIVLPLQNGKANVEKLAQAMMQLYEDKEEFYTKRALCKLAAKKFDMSDCTGRYLAFFNDIKK